MNKLFCSWLTGFYEGEGSIYLSRKRIHLIIYQKEETVLLDIQKICRCGVVKKRIHDKKTRRMMCRIEFNARDSLKILNKMQPHMRHPDKIKKLNKLLKLTSTATFRVCARAERLKAIYGKTFRP